MSDSIVTLCLPDLFRVRQNTFELVRISAMATSRYAGSVPRFADARDMLWRCQLETPNLSRESVIELKGFFANVAHGAYAISLYDPFQHPLLGAGNNSKTSEEMLFTTSGGADLSFCTDLSLTTGSGQALIKTEAARGASSILVKGLATSLEGEIVVRRGDHVGIGLPGEMNLYQATADAVCDASGECRISFMAPLWKRALVNDVVQFVKPRGRFVLTDMETGRFVQSIGAVGTGSLMAIEYPWQEPAA